MKKLKETIISEYRYDTEKEREYHIEAMKNLGFECDGQIKKSDDDLMKKDREYYWFARFFKYMV